MRQQPLFLHPWQAAQLMQHMALKANDPNALPDYVAHLASGTADYEGKIRAAWEAFKKNPTEANAHKFIQYLVNVSSDLWPAVLANVLGIAQDDLSPDQLQYLKDELETHHNYLKTSLMPDVIKAIGAGTLDSLNYRTIFLYAGALWAFGSLATVLFDGLSLRDLADVFLFAGPDDGATCDGERGCHQHVGKFYTVAEIIANGIIPGRLRCLTNCRHILIPIASPLREKEFGSNGNGVVIKHLPGYHDQRRHAPQHAVDLQRLNAEQQNMLRIADDNSIGAIREREDLWWKASYARTYGMEREEYNAAVGIMETAFRKIGHVVTGTTLDSAIQIGESGVIKGHEEIARSKIGTALTPAAQKARDTFDAATKDLNITYATFTLGMSPYGNVDLVMDSSVLEHSTATDGDSLSQTIWPDYLMGGKVQETRQSLERAVVSGKYAPRLLAGSMASQLSVRELRDIIQAGDVPEDTVRNLAIGKEAHTRYIEVQIMQPQGGISKDSVNALVYYTHYPGKFFQSESERKQRLSEAFPGVPIKEAQYHHSLITEYEALPDLTYSEGAAVLKHLPGEHDQRRHAPISVTRGSANIPKGQYDSHGSAGDRWAAEKQMNKLAGVKNYKDANAKGYFTVKIGDQYHIINTKKKAGTKEPKAVPPKPKEPKASKHLVDAERNLAINPDKLDNGIKIVSLMDGDLPADLRQDIHRAFKALPLAHQAAVDKLEVVPGEHLPTTLARSGTALAIADWQNRTIVMAGEGTTPGGIARTLAHETAHVLFMQSTRNRNETLDQHILRKHTISKLHKLYKERAAKAKWQEDMSYLGIPRPKQRPGAENAMTAVTAYARTNRNEFAAESYASYVRTPGVMQVVDPEAYAIVKDFFRGQEYANRKIIHKHLPGMHDQRSHGYRFGSQASSLSYLRQRRRDLTPEQWADYVQRARNKRDELLKKAPIRAKMLKDEQYAEEGKDANGCEYRIYMTTRKWWRNDITADQFSPDEERNRIKATIDNVRSILKDDPDFVKAIDYDGELMVRQANRRVGVHAVFTRQQDDFGMGSGGPGGAKVFYGPYDEIHRNAGLQKYMGTLSLGVDPIYVTVHELHHAFHSSSEFDEFSDAVTLDTHLKLGNNLMPVNVNNQLGDYVRRANYRAQGKYKHITLTSRVAIGWLYKRHKEHIDALVDESWGDRAGEVKAKLVQWSKIKPKPWRDEEYGYAEKHLAGQHDQRRHAPHGASARSYTAGRKLEVDQLDALRVDKRTLYETYPDSGDPYLRSIMAQQGFDGLPEVLTADEMDDYILSRNGGIELWRGVSPGYQNSISAEGIADEFRDGELVYTGRGVHGNGIYTTTRQEVAEGYASDHGDMRGVVVRMALRRDAKVIDAVALEDAMRDAATGRFETRKYAVYADYDAGILSEEDTRAQVRQIINERMDFENTYGDIFVDAGRYAASQGYDAIDLGNAFLILNRTAVKVDATNYYKEPGSRLKDMTAEFSRYMADVVNTDLFAYMPQELRARIVRSAELAGSVELMPEEDKKWVVLAMGDMAETLKHLPGEHDQRRHAPVTVTRASRNIAVGAYESHGSAPDRWTAEKQMNQLAGVKNYKDANAKGWYTVKIGDQYYVINVKSNGKPAPMPEPKRQPEPKPQGSAQQAISNKALIEPGIVDSGIEFEGQELNNVANTRVTAGLKKLPLSHQGALKKVQLVSSLSDCAGIAHISERWIELDAGDMQSKYGTYATVHEVGHVLLGDLILNRMPRGRNETPDDRKLRKTAGRALRKLYNKRARVAGVKPMQGMSATSNLAAKNSSLVAVSAYARTNANEFAAESYAFYVLQPNAMKRIDPEAYGIVKDLFKGQEYTDAGIKYKHLPGQHNQQRHAPVAVPVTVTRSTKALPAGEYVSVGSGNTRWKAEGIMNKLAGTKTYTEANAKGFRVVKIDDIFYVIDTNRKPGQEPSTPPKPKGSLGVGDKSLPEAQRICPGDCSHVGESDGGIIIGNGTATQKQTVAEQLAKLPIEHQKILRRVTVVDDANAYKAYGEEAQRNAAGVAHPQLRVMAVGGKALCLGDNAVHEAGHLVLGQQADILPWVEDDPMFAERCKATEAALKGEWYDRAVKIGHSPTGTGQYVSGDIHRKMHTVTNYAASKNMRNLTDSSRYLPLASMCSLLCSGYISRNAAI